MTRETTLLDVDGTNSVGTMLGLLGDEWTLSILQHSFLGLTRYGEFANALTISNSVLTNRLNRLIDTGLLERRTYRTNPVRAEYLPTARSTSLWPVFLSIWHWERSQGSDDTGFPAMRHTTCGHDFTPVLACRSCGERVEGRDVAAAWGPSGSWERSAPEASTRRRPDTGSSGRYPLTVELFGNRWSSALIGAAFRGLNRFSQFEAALGAPPTLVADRLRAFCAIGVLEARQSPGHPGWPAYRLTARGRAFFPVVVMTLRWADTWFLAPEGPAVVATHTPCGAAFVGRLHCDRCDGELHGRDITIVPVDEDRLIPGGIA